MDASENSISAVRGISDRTPGQGADRSAGSGIDRFAPNTAFAGTVTSIKQEAGAQTLEVQYSQGKIKFQAAGDFQLGEKVRLSFPGNGSVQVEKGAAQPAQGDGGAGYTLPANMSALKDLRAFEQNVTEWMSSPQAPGSPASVQDRQAMARLTFPQLLLKVIDKPRGKEFLTQALAGMDPGNLSALMDALEEAPGDAGAGAKPALLDLLRTAAKAAGVSDALRSMPGGTPARMGNAASGGAFMPAEAGAGHAPWFGRIMDKQQADAFLSPMQRLQFGGAGGPPQSAPMYRYLMDMGGGHSLEVFSSESKEPGAFADFQLEKQGGRMQARFTDPAASLPAGLKTAMAGAAPELRQGMLLASHYLSEFENEPYYGQLVEDFGEVLAQSGRMNPPTADGKPAGIPDQKDLDGLLKLFVAFPRDAVQPERQAKAWGDAVKDPQALLNLLKTLQPDQEASLLRSGTALHLAADGKLPAGAEAAMTAAAKAGEEPAAIAAWLKKALPEAFRGEDLMNLAKDASPPTQAGKDHDPAKFLLQAVANGLPREDQIREGQPSQFYFYQGQEWRNLQVTWERSGEKGRGKSGPKAPLQVRVETQSKHMGAVKVGVSWEPKGARLDFRNQFHDVRELLSQSLPELEKSLALMDFHVTAWSYDLLPDDAPAVPDPGWTRPASLSDGTNLDMLG